LYAIRLPAADEPALQQVVQLVEELVEGAVQGLTTLSLETLRWLRSLKPKEIYMSPFSCMQEQSSQQRAVRLWARLLCYCLRVVAVEERDRELSQLPVGLSDIARLFLWHG
jgi:hypothetical protein